MTVDTTYLHAETFQPGSLGEWYQMADRFLTSAMKLGGGKEEASMPAEPVRECCTAKVGSSTTAPYVV